MPKQIIINTKTRRLTLGKLDFACRIGKAGSIPMAGGREGDAKTPLGVYHLRFGLYRADRLLQPPSPLTFRPLREADGWCDAPSHEKLWRVDGAYDIILVMSHNDSPPVQGLGSAVFIHVAQPDDRNTLGCIALAPEEMVKLLPKLEVGMKVRIQE